MPPVDDECDEENESVTDESESSDSSSVLSNEASDPPLDELDQFVQHLSSSNDNVNNL